MNNLGHLLQAQGKLEEAQQLLRRAVTGGEAALGPDHPHTIHFRRNLAAVSQLI